MSGIDDLRSAIQTLEQNVSAENTQLQNAKTALAAAAQQITDLKAQIAAGQPVDDASLEELAQSIATVAQSAASAVSNGGDSPAPVQGGATGPFPPSGGDAGSTTAPTIPDQPPAGQDPGPAQPDPQTSTPGDPASASGEPGATTPDPSAAGTSKTLYVFDGDASLVDTGTWPQADVITQDGKPLYTYTGDSNPGDKQGDGIGGVWHAYDGPTQPRQ